MAKTLTKLGYLDKAKTVFLLCDIQEKFRPVMAYFDQIEKTSNKLIVAAKVFKIPLLCTEQNPAGLGHISSNIDISSAAGVFQKTQFTMAIPALKDKICNMFGDKLKTVVLFGMEAHVCVEQTAMDFTAEGYQVHVVADATISRSQEDRLLAFKRMENMGCIITTSENIIFKLINNAKSPEFKQLKDIIKTPSPNTGLGMSKF